MKSDNPHAHADARWKRLIEAEAFGELPEEDRDELEKLADEDETRQRERELLTAIGTLAPLDTKLSAEDERLIDSVLEQHTARAPDQGGGGAGPHRGSCNVRGSADSHRSPVQRRSPSRRSRRGAHRRTTSR